MVVGDEDGAVAMMEHPQPPVRLADPHAGLVGGQRRAGHQPRLDQAVCAAKGFRLAERNLSTSAPSLISRPNRSRSTWLNRARGIP